MNTLVVYESQFGNTKKIADLIGHELEFKGPARVVAFGNYTPRDLEGVDLLVVGGPTQAHGMTMRMRQFVAKLESKPVGIPAVAFDTRVKGPEFLWGSAAKEIATKLRFAGFKVVAQPESFLVTMTKEPRLNEGEEQRASTWAARVAGTVTTGHPVAA
jgi:flavodoxin